MWEFALKKSAEDLTRGSTYRRSVLRESYRALSAGEKWGDFHQLIKITLYSMKGIPIILYSIAMFTNSGLEYSSMCSHAVLLYCKHQDVTLMYSSFFSMREGLCGQCCNVEGSSLDLCC